MFFKRAFFRYPPSAPQYSLSGDALLINQDREYSDVPEKCIECGCAQSKNFKDFTMETVHVCPQCSMEYNISLLCPTEEEWKVGRNISLTHH